MTERGAAGALAMAAALLIVPVRAAADSGSLPETHLRIGLGFGIPYAVLGLSAEAPLGHYLSAVGAIGGTTKGRRHWAAGGRIYPWTYDIRFAPRVSFYRGTVARIWDENTDEAVAALLGYAAGGGFNWRASARTSLDFEILWANFDVPPGCEIKNRYVIALGYGYHF